MKNKTTSVWALAVPIILSNITVPLLGAVDAAVMGHMESAAYLGAVAVGGLIFDYIYWGFGFLRLSTTGLAAQALGAQDGNEARAVFGRAAAIAISGALLLWISQSLIFVMAKNMLEASPEVEGLAQIYFEVRIWSAPAALMNYALIGWILARKDTKGVLIQQVIANVVNVVLDLWFVMGLGYGVEGVAAATVIAQYVGMIFGFYILKKNLSGLDGEWHLNHIFKADQIKRLVSMNADLFIRTVCLLTSFAWFTSQGAKMSDVVLAANAILLQFMLITSYAMDGFAHAIEVLSGHAVGKKDRLEFKAAVKDTIVFSFVCAIVFTGFYFFAGEMMIGWFSDIEEVVQTAKTYLIWAIIMPLVSVWGYQLDGIYFGLTETKTLRNMMIISLVVYIPLSLLLMGEYGNHGLWASFTIFTLLRAITLGLKFPSVEKKVFA